ncbi:MAG: hypothetical protein ABIK45_09075 [Pseudomonadota bacterium]
MRGSLYQQLMTLLRLISVIGQSRHEAKQTYGGSSPFIHAVGTLDKTFQRLRPLVRWLREHGIKDLEQVRPDMVQCYLKDRLAHHVLAGNCRQSYLVELSALAALERALTDFCFFYRNGATGYDFKRQRKRASREAKQLPRRSPGRGSRAISAPIKAIHEIDDPKHKLMAQLQWETGCRAEGVGAPRRGKNPFSAINFSDLTTGEDLDLIADPVTKREVAPLWTVEKGGKLAFKYCTPETKDRLMSFFTSQGTHLEDDYCKYLRSVNTALEKTNQAGKGIGTHGFRFAFARRRYNECLHNGYTDEQAKNLVSQEMSHNRADITETYL